VLPTVPGKEDENSKHELLPIFILQNCQSNLEYFLNWALGFKDLYSILKLAMKTLQSYFASFRAAL